MGRFSYKQFYQNLIINNCYMRKLLFLISLIVLSQSASIWVNGTNYIVNKCEVYDLNAGNTFLDWGNVTICNNISHFFINVTTNVSLGVTFTENQSIKFDIFSEPIKSRLATGNFRYKSGDLTGKTTWADIGSLFIGGRTLELGVSSVLFGCSSVLYFVVHADVKNTSQSNTAFAGLSGQCQTASKDANSTGPAGWYCQIAYQASCTPPPKDPFVSCIQDPSQTDCSWDCQTGYADGSYPLNQLDTVKKAARWGWASKIFDTDEIVMKIYTGAGQNQYSKGEIVGEAQYVYINNIVYVKFILSPHCTSPSYHIYIGDSLPYDPVANGKFPYKGGPVNGDQGQYVPSNGYGVQVIDAAGDGIWIISHFNVCCVTRLVPPEEVIIVAP